MANIIFGIYSFGDSDIVLIEEFVRPHHVFHEIFPEGVPDGPDGLFARSKQGEGT